MAEADDGLFLIDGEDAGATPWEFDSIANEGANVFALDAAAKQYGTYGYSVTYDGTNDYAYGLLAFADQAEIYVRFYIYIPADFVFAAAWKTMRLLSLYDGANEKAACGFEDAATTTPVRWTMRYNAVTQQNSVTNFSLGAWHRIELHWVSHASTGGCELIVDGTTILTDMDQDTSAILIDRLRFGSVAAIDVFAEGRVFYLDDLKGAATGPIGAYSAGGTTIVPQVMAYYRRMRN